MGRHQDRRREWNYRIGNRAAHGLRLGDSMTGDLIRVILADDHNVVRAGLRAVLSVAKDIEVIGEAKTGREAGAMAERFNLDVVVMDLDMPDLDGTAATKEIVAKGLTARVLVLTMHMEEDYLVPLM